MPAETNSPARSGNPARILTGWALVTGCLFAQSGGVIYQARCAPCHETHKGDAPPLTALRAMPAAYVRATIDNGLMKEQAKGLTPIQRSALVRFIAGPAASGRSHSAGK